MARDENIKLLGDTIGIELEVESTERAVGAFSADILCKDTVNDHWVLVENQLERTDHTHLGQLLTYASGLNTVTIVWIAKIFTDEHRAALDWLNEITDERFNFFGIEVELWKIGESPIAPKFSLVSKPNDWTKSIGRAAAHVQRENLTEVKQLQLEFWTEFKEYVQNNSKIISSQKPPAAHWTNFAIGRSNFHMSASVNTRDKVIAVNLVFKGEHAKPHFHLLHEMKEQIESEIGEKIEWQEKPDKKESWVYLSYSADPCEKHSWPIQHAWLLSKLEVFHSVFSPLIKDLDADEYQGS